MTRVSVARTLLTTRGIYSGVARFPGRYVNNADERAEVNEFKCAHFLSYS